MKRCEPDSPGMKFDQEKPRTDLVSVNALMGMVAVLTFGAVKYDDRNWEKGITFGRVYGAALRHLFAWFNGEDLDPETGLSHLDHAATDIHFLSHYVKDMQKYREFDDRPKSNREAQGISKGIVEEIERSVRSGILPCVIEPGPATYPAGIPKNPSVPYGVIGYDAPDYTDEQNTLRWNPGQAPEEVVSPKLDTRPVLVWDEIHQGWRPA